MPFLLFFVATLCLFLYLGQQVTPGTDISLYYRLLFNSASADGRVDVQEGILIEPPKVEGEYLEGEFPQPFYGDQWASLNVEGWEEKNIPVYFGNSNELLQAGAAQAQFSRFCGQNGKVVLSAHVNLHFYEIEDAAARHEQGEEVLVTMDTLWGRYVYRVSEVIYFGYQDPGPLLPEEGRESLFFYTCYPRENSLAFKEQRIGLQCELVSGVSWRKYVEQ